MTGTEDVMVQPPAMAEMTGALLQQAADAEAQTLIAEQMGNQRHRIPPAHAPVVVPAGLASIEAETED